MYCMTSEFFRSKDGREYFWQWDTNQTLTVLRPELTEVHYASPDGTALVTKTYERDGQLLSDVPNILLQQSGWLTVWFCDDDKTIRSQKITIAARQKPASYVYTETEVLTWESLDERITALEESGGGEGPGTPGKDGKSAYEIAVEHGFEGSEEEWLESLQGEDGYTPIKGVDYFDGKDGRDGIDGQPGKDGSPGKDGYTPVKGVDYFDGKDGEPGQPGKDGYTPVKGVDYFDGEPGKDGYTPVKGIDYFDGQPGEPGKDGQDGYTPVKGVDYFDGKDGQPGAKGDPGDPGSPGQPGADGVSPIVSVQDIDGGHRVTITDAEGEKTFDVLDGKDGTGGGGASVQSDWTVNDESDPTYVKGRTHYDIPPEIDIQWDGDMTGRFALDVSPMGYAPGVYFVKVSNLVPTTDEVIGCTVSTLYNGVPTRYIVKSSDIDENSFPGSYLISTHVVVVHTQSILNGALGLPDGYIGNGVYFHIYAEAPASTWTTGLAGASDVKKLDKKYLPDFVTSVNGKTPDANGNVEIATGGGGSGGASVQADWSQNDPEQADYVKNRTHWVETVLQPIFWNGSTGGRDYVDVSPIYGYPAGSAIAYKISDYVLTKEDITTVTADVTYNGVNREVHFKDIYDMVPSAIWYVNYEDVQYDPTDDAYWSEVRGAIICTTVSGDFTSMFGVVIPSAGTYVVQTEGYPHSIRININVESKEVYHPLDRQFLPSVVTSVNGVSPDSTGNVIVEGGGSSTQSDWLQQDETSPNYVKNRTHYTAKRFKDMVWDNVPAGKEVVDLSLLGLPTGYKISDYVLNRSDIPESNLVIDYQDEETNEFIIPLTVYEDYCTDTCLVVLTSLYDSNIAFIASVTQAGTVKGITFPSVGTYISILFWDEQLKSYSIVSNETVIPLEEKYIPDTVARKTDVSDSVKNLDTLITNTLKGIYENNEVVYLGERHLFGAEWLLEVRSNTVRDIGAYFCCNCPRLHIVNLPNLTSTDQRSFESCLSLESISFPLATNISSSSFRNCTGLKEIDLPLVSRIVDYAFYGCESLTSITLPSVETLGINTFGSCTNLSFIDLPTASTIDYRAFNSCSKLKTLILRKTDNICQVDGFYNDNTEKNIFAGTPIKSGSGYIYVPKALIDQYKAAGGWCYLANQFRALEDYTVDGTVDGELDESKI